MNAVMTLNQASQIRQANLQDLNSGQLPTTFQRWNSRRFTLVRGWEHIRWIHRKQQSCA
jgi:hypothetical protein